MNEFNLLEFWLEFEKVNQKNENLTLEDCYFKLKDRDIKEIEAKEEKLTKITGLTTEERAYEKLMKVLTKNEDYVVSEKIKG